MEIFSKEQLLEFNEKLLGRGMPVQQDGIGYNKADYGACATYYQGLSNGQLADLAKRLVKYSATQLGVDKEVMKQTYNTLLESSNNEDRSNGVSINIGENSTTIHFRYCETFINCLRSSKKCQYNHVEKSWIVLNSNLVLVLNMLGNAGADVKNAIAYANDNELIKVLASENPKKAFDSVIEIMVELEKNVALLKFDYNKKLIEEIKKINVEERCWNQQFKFWAINLNNLENLLNGLSDDMVVKYV